MKILQYRGTGFVSKAIQMQTRSPYSHTAIQFSDGMICEAWHTGGKRWWHGCVRWIKSPWDGHAPDTVIDVYRIEGYVDEHEARAFAESHIGDQYDFISVVRFLNRREAPVNDKWFCSELALACVAQGGLDLLHGNPARMSPRDVAVSPLLHYEKTI